jgi:hypothetical protein
LASDVPILPIRPADIRPFFFFFEALQNGHRGVTETLKFRNVSTAVHLSPAGICSSDDHGRFGMIAITGPASLSTRITPARPPAGAD